MATASRQCITGRWGGFAFRQSQGSYGEEAMLTVLSFEHEHGERGLADVTEITLHDRHVEHSSGPKLLAGARGLRCPMMRRTLRG